MARRKSKWDVPAEVAGDSSNGTSTSNSAAEAAKERAAKLTAMLAAKGKLAKNAGSILPLPSQAVIASGSPLPKVEKDQDIITAEVQINDSPARTKLCKGTTQDEISRYSGAAVSTKGRFMEGEELRKQDLEGVKPLYLCIQGTTQDKVDMAVQRIREIMSKAETKSSQTRWSPYQRPPPPVVNSSYLHVSNMATQPVATQALPTGMHYVQDKVFIGLDSTCSPDFDVKGKLLGPGGSYFQHISTQTGAKVFLRGRGSGFLEPTSGREAFEALHIYLSHTKPEGLSAAKSLVQNLIQTVNTEYQTFEQMKRAQQPGHIPGYPPPIPGYMPPMEYPLPRPGMPPPPGGYPGPPLPPPQYYGHPPPPGQPQPPPPGPPYGQTPPPPPGGYGIPPPPRGQSNGGPPTTYPGYPSHQAPAPPPPGDNYPPRPSLPPENGQSRSQPNIPMQEMRRKDHNNRERNLQQERHSSRPPPPREERRRFKEASRSEPPPLQESQPRTFQESETSSLGNKPQERSAPPKMPPPLMPQLSAQSKPSEDFKKPSGVAKPFLVPPSPKDIIKKESTVVNKPEISGTTRKHGLPTTDASPSSSKKVKKEEAVPALMSLVAYDGGSSSEEEDEQTPHPLSSKGKMSPRNKKQTLPFWAVKK